MNVKKISSVWIIVGVVVALAVIAWQLPRISLENATNNYGKCHGYVWHFP